jgi:hypothetical protein
MAKKKVARVAAGDPVSEFLTKLSKPLVAELKTIIKAPQPEDTALLDFELHLSNTLDIVASPMNSGAGQLGGTFLLKSSERHLPNDLSTAQSKALAPAIISWFSECWDQAGGAKFGLPAYVFQHDSLRSFGLRKKVWIADSKKWND